jgi:hypothetical protein
MRSNVPGADEKIAGTKKNGAESVQRRIQGRKL